MASPKIGPSFFGKVNYEKYISELTTEGTIGGEKLTPGERVEGFKKRNDKISFESFVNKVLARKKPEEKEKIREGNINRVNIEYDNKVPTGDEIKKYGAITRVGDILEDQKGKTLSGNRRVGADSKLMSLESIKPVIEEQTISLFKDENGTFRSEVDPVIKKVSSDDLEGLDELLETIRDEPEGLDDLLKEVRESDSVQPITDDQKEVLDNLTKANKSLLSTNELIEGFIKSVEKENLKEKKKRFKEKDAARKRARKESFERSRSLSPIGGLSKSIAKPSGFLEGLLKFGFLSALAGLVPLIPKLIEFVESIPSRIETFFKETIPNFIQEKFTEFKDTVTGFFTDRFNEVKEFFEGMYDNLDEFTGGRLTEFIDGVKGLGPMIVEKSKEFYKTIDDWTGGRISGAFDWIGKNVLDPMTNFFSEKINWLGTEAGKLWDNFSKTFLNFLPDLGITEALGITPKIEGPDLSGDVVTMGDSIAVGVRDAQGVSRDTSMAEEGAGTEKILANIQQQASAGNLQGKTLQLSSGITNTRGDSETVREQLRAAKEGGATGVQLMGTANEGQYAQNNALQAIAQEDEFKDFVKFQGGFKSKDTMHPENYGKYAESLATSRQENIQQRQQGGGSGKWGPLLDLVASKESGGNYEALNPSTTLPGATKMTISDVAKEAERVGKSKGGTGAVGKYQQLPWYLVDRAIAAGLDPDKDLFSPKNQDLIITKVNIEKNRDGDKWLKGEISDVEFMQGLSQEFSSLPNAQGAFHYPGQSSSMTPEKVKEALDKVKRYRPRSAQPRPFSTSLTTALDDYDAQQRLGPRQLPQTVSTEKVVPNRDQIAVTSRRGMRWGKMHHGSDIASPIGSPLHAFTDGVITDTGYEGGYGNYIAWKDIFGMEHFYAHLDKIMAKRGDSVKAGDVIGKSGQTGRGTGPHLHWEYGPEGQTGRNGAGLVDPLDKFDYMMPFGSKKILSKPDDSPQPIPSRPVSFAPELGRLKQSADSISTPSGRRSAGGNITTINMPPTQTKTPTVTTSRDGGGNEGQYTSKPVVSAINFDDMYQTHTRSLFNILR